MKMTIQQANEARDSERRYFRLGLPSTAFLGTALIIVVITLAAEVALYTNAI